MASSGFNFKQFHVAHDRCAMKVGTDGVLLGAWAGVAGASRVLDVGCGSGMVAQRTAAHVVGVEIDAPAAEQAIENVAASPWAHRIEIVHADVSDLCPDEKFDHIVSNPPFFAEDLLPPDVARARARHTAGLTFERLFCSSQVDIFTPLFPLQPMMPSLFVRGSNGSILTAVRTSLRGRESPYAGYLSVSPEGRKSRFCVMNWYFVMLGVCGRPTFKS